VPTRPLLTRIDRLRAAALAASIVLRGLAMARTPRSLEQRVAAFPTTAPSSAPLRIHWDSRHIPFIEADSEPDLAVGLGMVHAHLRLAQIELLRRIAQGRAAEIAGPLALPVDQTIRSMDVGRAVPAIIAGLSPDVRAWAEGFVRGVNHVLGECELPEEMRLLGIPREAWTLTDLFTSSRLAAADISWFLYARLLRARANLPRADWMELWQRLMSAGMPNPEAAPLGVLARAGSNAAAVAGSRSASGAGMLAADPHLSIALPNIWLAAAMRCPTLNAAGLMPAGFPVIAIGRNRHIAWAGTSLHAAASDLFDASTVPITSRAATVRVRGVGTRTLTLRESALGPVVSDTPAFRHPTPLALRWVGHLPSNEMEALFGVMRAETRDDFMRALDGFGLPGQNMVYATADGHVGHVLALRSPRREGLPRDVVLPPSAAAAWERMAHTRDFPARHDPPSGVAASANDEAPQGSVAPGYFYSPPDRMRRLRALLETGEKVTFEALARTQLDVQGQREMLDRLLARLPQHPVRDELSRWDGAYGPGSRGALAWEALLADLTRRLPDQAKLLPLSAVWTGRTLILRDALSLDDATLQPILARALDAAAKMLRRYGRWGAIHRMRVRHYFGAVPGLGRRYRFGEFESPGGNDTLNKTGHGPVRGPHPVSYGASARFVTDLVDLDSNHVVLLGGQDGWVGSETFADQVTPWRRGESVPLPLRPETARAWPHHSVLQPA
jgi:penicillin amidase